jgi:hypothetical protein
MKTLLLTCPCDSLVAKVCANVCACGPKVVEQGANWADVKIAETICSNVFWIILALAISFILWKIIDVIAKCISSCVIRSREIEDINRKQKSDLLDLKLKMLKELCDTEAYKKAGCINDKYIEIPTNEGNPAPNPENNGTNNNAEPPKETNPKKETEKNKEDKPTKDSLSSNVKAYIAAVDDAIKKLNDNNPSNSSSKDGASKS